MKYLLCCMLSVTLATMQAQVPDQPGTRTQDRVVNPADDPFSSSIAVADSGVQRLMIWLDEWEAQLATDSGSEQTRASNLNLSKSNVDRKSQSLVDKSRTAVEAVSTALDNLEHGDPMERGIAYEDLNVSVDNLEAPIFELYQQVKSHGRSGAAKAEELKTRHEAVKNSINNIRS